MVNYLDIRCNMNKVSEKKYVSFLLQLDWTLVKWINKKCCIIAVRRWEVPTVLKMIVAIIMMLTMLGVRRYFQNYQIFQCWRGKMHLLTANHGQINHLTLCSLFSSCSHSICLRVVSNAFGHSAGLMVTCLQTCFPLMVVCLYSLLLTFQSSTFKGK